MRLIFAAVEEVRVAGLVFLFYMLCAFLSSIDERRGQVVARRAAVKEAAAARQAALDASHKFQDFSADVDDLRSWMADKLKTASDESYRDLTNLERKLQKHEAFERELHANEGQLRTVNKVSCPFPFCSRHCLLVY
jgi:spectrin beta